ncbi:MAG TPA: isoprenylcysteine carboxylmethyltransferase family protein [Candidatus Solibacter sp.]|jgi:protein-S-isoprenylcysteine O-methyltransferase Ste14
MILGLFVLAASWILWFWPFAFRAPHNQRRPSITLATPTRVGLLLECAAIAIAFLCRQSFVDPLPWWRLAGMMIFGPIAGLLSWSSVRHLGRQFRVNAGLYEDHELVTTGPYALVRHPIYASLLAILASTLFLFTPWQWAIFSIALFLAGTEIRVATEDGLLDSRFGERFALYKSRVKAYIPMVR